MGHSKQSDRDRLLRLLAGESDLVEASVGRLMEHQPEAAAGDWREGLPVLRGARVTLRELHLLDVPGLMTNLGAAEVTRFLSPPPRTVDEFERFIAWTQWERAAGSYACFAVVPEEFDTAVGLFQLRMLEPSFATAEWGFVLGSAFWGTGLFRVAADLVLKFAFGRIGTHRLEARVAVPNGRGNAAMRKIGAVQEGVLRRSLVCDGQYVDQTLWSILEEDWRHSQETLGHTIH